MADLISPESGVASFALHFFKKKKANAKDI
jgi:hypothetical protein